MSSMSKLKDIDYLILSELMKNSKMSDRKLSEKLGVSQPTVTRRRARLEEAGIIKEYTFIPEFTKLGYHILAITLFKYGSQVPRKEVLKAREKAKEVVKESPFEMIMAERGMGAGYDGVAISIHRDYGSYLKFQNWMRQSNPAPIKNIESFLVNLDDEIHFRPLTFSTLANHLLKVKEEK